MPHAGSSAASFVLVCAPAGLLWWFHGAGFGGGDWKLLSSLAAWAGLRYLPDLLLGTALAGGAETVAVLVFRAAVPAGSRLREGVLGPLLSHRGIPYGVAISAGGILVIFDLARGLA